MCFGHYVPSQPDSDLNELYGWTDWFSPLLALQFQNKSLLKALLMDFLLAKRVPSGLFSYPGLYLTSHQFTKTFAPAAGINVHL